MKTGDPKQVAVLSVVALGALGFVGSTAFKTIKQNSFSGPVLVEEIGRDGTIATDNTAEAPARSDTGVADVFADSFTPAQKSDPEKALVSVGAIDTGPPSAPTSAVDETPEPLPGVTEPEEPDLKSAKPEHEAPKPTRKTIAVQYMGFVESGSAGASAILTVDGANITVSTGDSLGDGLTIKAISSNAISVKSTTGTYSIFIGKEKQIS